MRSSDKPSFDFVVPFAPDPKEFVPSVNDFIRAKEDEIDALQKRTRAAFSLEPKRIMRQLTINGTAVNSLGAYDSLWECVCVGEFDRTFESNTRTRFTQHIVSEAVEFGLGKSNQDPLHIAAIGSGALLHEMFLLVLLHQNGISNIRLDIVDLFYADPNLAPTKLINLHTEGNLKALIRQFLTLVHFGLGLKIIVDETVTEDANCAILSKEIGRFAKRETAIHRNSQLSSGSLCLRVFSSAEIYAKKIAETHSVPHIVYSVDLDPPETQREIMRPVMHAANAACFFTAVKKREGKGVTMLRKKQQDNLMSISVLRAQ